jgi:osmotically-inducible protein OsmY
MKYQARFLLLLVCATPLVTAGCGGGAAVSRTIDDATITTHIKTALLNAPEVDATKIDVDTAAGVVTLRGLVRTKDEEAKALAVARRVSGVRDVRSELKVQ